MKKTNEKLQALQTELAKVRYERDMEISKYKENLRKYHQMEGMYAKGMKVDEMAGQGFRPWFFTYNEGERAREDKERDEFYETHNLSQDEDDILLKYSKEIERLENLISIEQDGITLEEKRLLRLIKQYKNEIAYCEHTITLYKGRITEAEEKLTIIRANKS